MHRREFMTAALGSVAASALPAVAANSFEVVRTEAEWRAMLTDREYSVMREAGTEDPFSSPLNDITRAGVYHCRGCEQPLYPSETKFESGTGWPSFSAPLPNAVATKPDRMLLFYVRTEVHCDRCGSHLGHIFDDGPAPTGKRHCLNGVSLTFHDA